jgi:hypothetical protein
MSHQFLSRKIEDGNAWAGKVMMSSRTTSGNHSEAWQAASDAMEAAGSPLPQRALNDSSDAWLTLKQQSLEGAKLAQQEEDDEKLAEVRQQLQQPPRAIAAIARSPGRPAARPTKTPPHKRLLCTDPRNAPSRHRLLGGRCGPSMPRSWRTWSGRRRRR